MDHDTEHYDGRAVTEPGRRAFPRFLAVARVHVALMAAVVTALMAAGAGASPAAPAAGVDTLPRIEVRAIEFPGARALDRDRLLDAIVTRSTSCASPLFVLACLVGDWDWSKNRAWLDPAVVEADVRRLALLHEAWGYPDVDVGVAYDTAAQTAVRFRVREGPPLVLESMEIRGLDAFDPPIRRPDRLPLRPGEPYALPRLGSVEDWLRDRMAARGHPFGRVEFDGDIDTEARTARLVLTLDPGPAAVFGDARIEALEPIEESTVRSTLRFEPGAPYHLAPLYTSERALYHLPIVQRVVIQPAVATPPTGDSAMVPVDVRVVPRKARGVELESTLSSTECLAVAGTWKHRYFLGGPRLLGIGAGLANLGAGILDGGFPCTSTGTGEYAEPHGFVEATLRQPWPRLPETQIEAGFSASRSTAPGVYVLERVGATLAVSHGFGASLVGMLRYAPSYNALDATAAYFCGSYGVCARPDVDALQGPRWFAPVEATITWTPAGVPRQAVPPDELEARALWGPLGWRGWIRAGVEAGGRWSGSDWSYGRALVEASATRPLGLRTEVAAHLRAGAIAGSDVLPPFVRLYAGGLYSVRGYAENALGPATLITTPATAADLGCDPVCPGDLTVGPGPVSVRPTGGDGVWEASVEARRWLTDRFQVAAFLDLGAVRRGPLRLGDGAGPALDGGWTVRLTPGIGVRLLSNLGPTRLDLGYDPAGPRSYPLFVGDDDLGFRGRVRYDPFTYDDPSLITEVLRRIQLHVGFGQPF
jgi:hypothetical protein